MLICTTERMAPIHLLIKTKWKETFWCVLIIKPPLCKKRVKRGSTRNWPIWPLHSPLIRHYIAWIVLNGPAHINLPMAGLGRHSQCNLRKCHRTLYCRGECECQIAIARRWSFNHCSPTNEEDVVRGFTIPDAHIGFKATCPLYSLTCSICPSITCLSASGLLWRSWICR